MTWPWERMEDRNERPLPVARRDGVKVFLMVVVVALAYLFFDARSSDEEHEGAALLVAIGGALAATQWIQLRWLPSSKMKDRIFIKDPKVAARVYGIAIYAGLGAVVIGFLNGA